MIPPAGVKLIQQRLGWSNRVLGLVLGVATRTVEEWRGGRRTCEGTAELALLLLDRLKERDVAGAMLWVERGEDEQAKPPRRRGKTRPKGEAM